MNNNYNNNNDNNIYTEMNPIALFLQLLSNPTILQQTLAIVIQNFQLFTTPNFLTSTQNPFKI